MIYILIIILALILVGLLVDWQSILKRKDVAAKLPKMPKVSALSARKKEPLLAPVKKEKALPAGKQSSMKDFDLDVPDAVPIEQVIPEEEENPSYRSSREVEELLAEADICFRKGEVKAAENFYLQAAAKDPRCSKAYSRLGVIYLENGDNWEDAEAAFRQALKTDPDNGFILNNLGLVLYHQDKYADAIRHFEQAVRQDDLNAARHANLGMGYMAMRQYAKAESSFKKALKLAPNEMEYKDLLNESIEKKKAHKTMIRH